MRRHWANPNPEPNPLHGVNLKIEGWQAQVNGVDFVFEAKYVHLDSNEIRVEVVGIPKAWIPVKLEDGGGDSPESPSAPGAPS